MTKKTRTTNRLDRRQIRRLEDWTAGHRSTILGLTCPEAAETAAKDLGFPVTAGNMKGAAEVMDAKFRGSHGAVHPDAGDLLTLAAWMVQTMGSLGLLDPENRAAVPQRIQELAEGGGLVWDAQEFGTSPWAPGLPKD